MRESHWWFGAYLAVPAAFVALLMSVLKGFLETVSQAAGPQTSAAVTESSFGFPQFPQELIIGVEILTWLFARLRRAGHGGVALLR